MTIRESPQRKPLPELTELTRPFWTAAREGRLVVQQCAKCGTRDFYPKPWCIECGHRQLDWVEVSGTGTVYSHTAATTVMMNLPGWKDELPVVLCLIDLDDGPRMYAQLTDCAPADVRIGMRVRAHFAEIGGDAGIVRFRPA
ncbi:MAG TPA: Zn-ribbon domain-containing OB-fold protein [Burkholderiaceae bacterium]|jgi:uncharacterized protein|nr:Zn-ribbon domain-containing OB-fold protein [Burkholderiaceae bacterium]